MGFHGGSEMIEVLLCGDYLGVPHEVGAWAYLVRSGEELIGEGKGSDRPEIIASRLATEVAALTLALEELTRGCNEDEVLVRTTSVGLEGLLIRRGAGAPRDVSRWYQRLRTAAARCSSVRIMAARRDEVGELQEVLRVLLPTVAPQGLLPPSRARLDGRGL